MTVSHKFDERHVEFLHSKERRKILPREKVLDFVDSLFPLVGKTVADIGAGTGYFTIPLLERVGKEGQVIAIDINKKLLSFLEEKVANADNVKIVVSKENHIPVENETIDVAFCADLFHELDGNSTLKEVYRILKSEGLFVAVDWEKGKGGVGPSDRSRLSRGQARAFCESAGLIFERTFDPGKHHYGLVFKK